MKETKQKIIAIAGPSATGKSELAIKLAKHLNTEIISVDSRQIYKEINIGSAKPTESEKEGIKHHLMDFLGLEEEYTVANFSDDALSIINSLFEQEKTPVLVGGTGLYYRVLLQDFDLPRVAPDKAMREKLEKKTNGELYSLLCEKDIDTAKKIHPNNRVKVIRALEVILTLNEKMSVAQKKKENPFEVLWVGLDAKDRQFLYERANRRVDKMIEKGLIKEAKTLFEKYPNNKILTSTIGYQEFLPYIQYINCHSEAIENIDSSLSLRMTDAEESHINGRTDFSLSYIKESCTEKLKQNTRNYIKRQLSWFRANKNINWFYIDEMSLDEIFDSVILRSEAT